MVNCDHFVATHLMANSDKSCTKSIQIKELLINVYKLSTNNESFKEAKSIFEVWKKGIKIKTKINGYKL